MPSEYKKKRYMKVKQNETSSSGRFFLLRRIVTRGTRTVLFYIIHSVIAAYFAECVDDRALLFLFSVVGRYTPNAIFFPSVLLAIFRRDGKKYERANRTHIYYVSAACLFCAIFSYQASPRRRGRKKWINMEKKTDPQSE